LTQAKSRRSLLEEFVPVRFSQLKQYLKLTQHSSGIAPAPFDRAMAKTEKQNAFETRVIWAIDPFARQAEAQKSAIWAIQAMTQRQSAYILPVYVASDPRHQIAPKLRGQFKRQLAYEAQDELDSWLGSLETPKLKGLQPLQVIGPTGSSLREQVSELLEFARAENADLIVASTRAKRGPPRWFFGSFVETLSLICDLPLVVVNPHWNPIGDSLKKPVSRWFERILFPTDFSDESHQALLHLLPFAQKMKSRITLFHKISMGLAVMPETAISMVSLSEEAREAEVEVSRQNAEQWCREARRAGVEADAIIDYYVGEPVAAAVVKEAKRVPSLIAMAGESTRLEAQLLGSVTRQVLRDSPYPVWVIHPTAEEERRRRIA
jgi:nucleotide-binding universal stress UspA family protein